MGIRMLLSTCAWTPVHVFQTPIWINLVRCNRINRLTARGTRHWAMAHSGERYEYKHKPCPWYKREDFVFGNGSFVPTTLFPLFFLKGRCHIPSWRQPFYFVLISLTAVQLRSQFSQFKLTSKNVQPWGVARCWRCSRGLAWASSCNDEASLPPCSCSWSAWWTLSSSAKSNSRKKWVKKRKIRLNVRCFALLSFSCCWWWWWELETKLKNINGASPLS